MSLDTVAVIVMAKFPQPGNTKTRLTPALSPEHAAMIQRAFIPHVMSRLQRLGPPELVMCFDPPERGHDMYQLVGSKATRYVAQSKGDLGQRMHAAARELAKWYGRLMILGVDSPDVPVSHITRVNELLRDNELVLGPCSDGGFWCVGMQDHVNLDLLFDDVDWSSGQEREQTLAAAKTLEYSCAEADAWDDVDRPEDLHKLLARLSSSDDADDRRLLAALSFLPQGVVS